MASFLIDGAIKGASFYLIDDAASLDSISSPSDLDVAYIPNGTAYIYDTDKWTVFEDFDPKSVFPLAFEPLDEHVTFTGNAKIIAKMDAPEPVGDDEDNAEEDNNGGDE